MNWQATTHTPPMYSAFGNSKQAVRQYAHHMSVEVAELAHPALQLEQTPADVAANPYRVPFPALVGAKRGRRSISTERKVQDRHLAIHARLAATRSQRFRCRCRSRRQRCIRRAKSRSRLTCWSRSRVGHAEFGHGFSRRCGLDLKHRLFTSRPSIRKNPHRALRGNVYYCYIGWWRAPVG